jgi:hypothetical protein
VAIGVWVGKASSISPQLLLFHWGYGRCVVSPRQGFHGLMRRVQGIPYELVLMTVGREKKRIVMAVWRKMFFSTLRRSIGIVGFEFGWIKECEVYDSDYRS